VVRARKLDTKTRVILKEECRKEGLTIHICDSITVEAGTAECHGTTCWLVYGHANDPNRFSGTATVSSQNGQYVVIDYLRDTGVSP